MTNTIRVMLVDDHYLVRVGLASIIALEQDMVVCAEASSGEQALELFRRERPDVTLMDLRLGGMMGLEALQAIRRESPNARVIILSTFAGDEDIYRALQAGAMAYLTKSVERADLITVIRKAASGQRYMSPEVAERLAARLPRSELSRRELDVLRLVVGGRRNREIAQVLDISEGTVKIHVSNILGKLGAGDRTEAATTALQRGIVQLGP
jgi:DNA-binding NarL/FixJ family response regulator